MTAPKLKIAVTTRDVDGGTHRTYASMKGARARFESMAGHTIEAALIEQFWGQRQPDLGTFTGTIRTVSNYGTVVRMTISRGA